MSVCVWGGGAENGEIMQIRWEKNEVFREKPEPAQLLPTQATQPLNLN
jgi:hypothetical protein